ncbi:MAG: response regulator [Candidatus Dadabacteria bacterium]
MERVTDRFNRVVIADDDPDHSLLFRIVLKQVDASKELVIVHDGPELMELLQYTLPDILFLDLNMPCKNGYDCLEEIRQDPRLCQLPVVVYSSSSDITEIRKCFEHQADLYMVKAFNSIHLTNALESILKLDWWNTSSSGQRYYFMNNRFVPYTAD